MQGKEGEKDIATLPRNIQPAIGDKALHINDSSIDPEEPKYLDPNVLWRIRVLKYRPRPSTNYDNTRTNIGGKQEQQFPQEWLKYIIATQLTPKEGSEAARCHFSEPMYKAVPAFLKRIEVSGCQQHGHDQSASITYNKYHYYGPGYYIIY
ncbi:hypothetical protein FQN53_002485 [Emmonsiellopsis sp. PD_33]|nr:hypothetical protein FQN53_002485 [Emmonsiellopsis sp. PD_33]KAK2798256.1 hypothetical protein FQN51_007822 [Onygenales sp. PD_10]